MKQHGVDRRALLAAGAALMAGGASCTQHEATSVKSPANGWPGIASDADVEALLPTLTNWGRWGANDELGALNLITPERRVAAASAIRSGQIATLGRETDINANAERGEHTVDKRTYGSRDYTAYVFHGFEMTHLDALGHAFATPQALYDGGSTDAVTPDGLQRLGVDAMAERGIAGRGVLLDLAALNGGPLEPGVAVQPEALDAAAEQQKTAIKPGDMVFIRTGLGRRNTRESRAGLHHRCLPWLKARDIALLGGDGDSDAAPLPGFERWGSPMHSVAIPYLGLPLIDNADLEALSDLCANQSTWSFFCALGPLKLKGATGSAVNPVAIL